MSRKDIRELIEQRAVTLHRKGAPLRPVPGMPVCTNDDVQLHRERLLRALPDPSIPLKLLAETEDWVVIDKPFGLPSGATRTEQRKNAASALLARFPEIAEVGFNRFEPGLVHRLDTFTSGALLAARTPHAFKAWRNAWEVGAVKKGYLAVATTASEHSAAGARYQITSELIADPAANRRVCMVPGKRYTTQLLLLARGRSRALFAAEAKSAYRHQIRVHMAHLGFPLVGDALYGVHDQTGAPRHGLHAHYIEWAGTVPPLVVSPFPADLIELLVADGLSRETINALTSRSS